MECFCYLLKYRANRLAKSDPMKEQVMLHSAGHFFRLEHIYYCHPSPQKDSRHDKVLLGIFTGFTLHAGGGWAGDLLIADRNDLEKNVASEVGWVTK